QRTQGFDQGRVRHHAVEQLDAAAAEHPRPTPPGQFGELSYQACLTDPCLAADNHGGGVAFLSSREGRLELAELLEAAHEAWTGDSLRHRGDCRLRALTVPLRAPSEPGGAWCSQPQPGGPGASRT